MTEGRLTGAAEKIEDVALLLPQGVSGGEHTLGEAAAGRAVGAEAGM